MAGYTKIKNEEPIHFNQMSVTLSTNQYCSIHY